MGGTCLDFDVALCPYIDDGKEYEDNLCPQLVSQKVRDWVAVIFTNIVYSPQVTPTY